MTQPAHTDRFEELMTDDPIAEAARSYPSAETPVNFSAGVMARLQALPANVRPRFRLSWFDWAISLFTTGMAGIGFLVWQSLPPQVVAQLQMTGILFVQRIAPYLPHLPGLQ
jgi:hypothetical protein